MDGRSLASLLTTGASADWRGDLLLEHWARISGRTDAGVPDFAGLRTTDYMYVEYATGEVELYNIHNDPYELANQYYANPAALLKQLSDRVAALRSCRGASCR
jgi:hypothetical protein